MRIVHFCLSCFYIDNFSYQENELVAQNVRDGHEVLVIASTETFGNDGRLTNKNPGEYIGSDGALVFRLPYRGFLPLRIMRKIRAHPNVFDLLEKFKPDVILFHGICGWELLTVARYRRNHGDVRLYVDSHTDFNNSARGWGSRYLLHYLFYRVILRKSLKNIDKILCVSLEVMEFAEQFYGVPREKTEFFPLGGKVLSFPEYSNLRSACRSDLGVAASDLIFLQTGKIDSAKKLIESLNCFLNTRGGGFHFIIAGSLQDDIKIDALRLIESDPRIRFLGWKNPEELRALLCAADVYVQPGSQSATMQMSICCRCAVILDDVLSHKPYIDGNGWLVGKGVGLQQVFHDLASLGVAEVSILGENSGKIAANLLDYQKLATRLYF